eukprot:4278025-Lingulodinium_polyedra.AAC.1
MHLVPPRATQGLGHPRGSSRLFEDRRETDTNVCSLRVARTYTFAVAQIVTDGLKSKATPEAAPEENHE